MQLQNYVLEIRYLKLCQNHWSLLNILISLIQMADIEICAVLCLLISSDGFPILYRWEDDPHTRCELCPAICPRGQEI